jgi:hypothetical protein
MQSVCVYTFQVAGSGLDLVVAINGPITNVDPNDDFSLLVPSIPISIPRRWLPTHPQAHCVV